LLALLVGFAALFLLIPGLPLIAAMFLSQVFDRLLLPIILVFVMLLARDRKFMGRADQRPAPLGRRLGGHDRGRGALGGARREPVATPR
jgi:Mn2+/Fe2+ NRAMP family transporter